MWYTSLVGAPITASLSRPARRRPIPQRGHYMDESESGASIDPGASALDAGSTTRLVWNPFLGLYLAQSPARMSRRELTGECPFCADLTSGRVPAGTQAWIRPNDFPPLRPPQGEAYILIYSADHPQTF